MIASRRIGVKRVFDILIAGSALVVLAPLIVIIAVTIAIFNGRPVFFTQLRPGIDGVPFRLIKFRSMSSEPDAEDEQAADSVRLTRIGRILRAASLDELPELWNILVGDMSLVGPRPLLMEYLPLYSEEQARRHSVKPGLTGWAQVNGRNSLTWEERFALDLWYIDNQSFMLDVRILWLTIGRVLSRQGISHSGEATMSKFTGSTR